VSFSFSSHDSLFILGFGLNELNDLNDLNDLSELATIDENRNEFWISFSTEFEIEIEIEQLLMQFDRMK
jgi:hypothetical protein